MKRVFSALAVMLTLAAGGADAALTALAPADYTAVISVNVRRLLGNRDIQHSIMKPELAKLFTEVERAGVRIAHIRELTIFSWNDRWYGALHFEDAPRLRQLLELKSAAGDPKIAAEELDGKKIFRLKRPEEKNPRRRNKELCLVFGLGNDDVVLLAKAVEIKPFLSCARVTAAEAKHLADTDADAWCRDRPDMKKKGDGAGAFDMELKLLELELWLTGDGIEIGGIADLGDPESARKMSTMLPGIMAILTGYVLADDPETADKIVRALRAEVNGNELRLSLNVPREVLRRFLKSLESLFGSEKRRRGIAVPHPRRRGGD